MVGGPARGPSTPAGKPSTLAAMPVERAMRLGVFQPSLMRYRVPLFAEVARRAGVELTVYHADLGGANVPAAGFRAVEGPVKRVRLGGEPWYWQRAHLRELGSCDVAMFTWDAHYLSLPPALRRARKRGVGTVLWGHGFGGREGSLMAKPKRWLARAADALLLYSDADADAYRAAGYADCFAANNAVDVEAADAARAALTPVRLAAFREAHGLDGRRVLLHVSRLVPERRLDLAVRALAELKDDVVLAALGDGPARADVARLAADLGVASRVRLPGAVWGEAALAPWFAAAELYVHPNHLGLSGLHAMAHGLPVVTGDVRAGHGPEWAAVVDGQTGRLFADGDANALARTIAALLKDDAGRRRLGENAAALVREKHTIAAMADGLLAAARAAWAISRQAR